MQNLYMFAIMPPAELERRISEERIDFSEKYNCHKALKPPVHITLCEPFKTDHTIEEKIKGLEKWIAAQTPMQIDLRNFGYFKNAQKPVLYIDVVKNEELRLLRKGFIEQVRKYVHLETNNKPFAPHITIGYRDVSTAIFPAIMEEYSRRGFHGSFLFDTIYFWKHNGINWQVLYAFPMKGPKAESSLETSQHALF